MLPPPDARPTDEIDDRVRAVEERYRIVVEEASDGIFLSDADGRLLEVNRAGCELLGYARRELLRLTLADIVAPDELARLPEEIGRLRGGRATPSQWRFLRRDGSTFPGEVHARELSDGRLLGHVRDITAHKRAEALLRQSEERYRLIVENQTEFIVKWLPDGTRTFVNDSYCRTFDVREEECIGTNFFPLVAPEYRDFLRERVAGLAPDAPAFTEEHVSLLPAGRRWQQWTSRGIFDADGRLVEVLSTGRDITELKDAEERLRQSQTHLLASQHIAKIGSWEMDLASLDDLDANPLRWSDECFRILGYEPSAVQPSNDTFFARVHPDDRQRVHDSALHAAQTRSPYSVDYRIALDDGTERVIHEQAEPEMDSPSGRPVKFVGTTQDITDRVRLEEQLRQSQKIQAIGQLAGGVAHDFNNLLTVINGHAEMLLERIADDELAREDLKAIRDAGERAALLTRQLLLFSRKAVLEPRVLSCGALVQRTSELLRRLISEEVVLSTAQAPSPWRIRADPSQIEQVIMNLSLNACDAMPQGGRLSIETRNVTFDEAFCRSHPEYRPGRYVQLVVSDTGCGMSAAVKAHLFEPFFTTKGPGRGTGLGLATVYGIVQASGGFITVASQVNDGTTFNVFLPAFDDDAPESQGDAIDHDRLQGRETVLLVEDDPAVRAITRRTLQRYGYRVLEAGGGSAALRLSDEHFGRIDVLVSDIVMPGMTGRRLADVLLTRRPECRVLFMSGYNEEMLADRGAATSEGFIQKPFAPVTLVVALRDVLDRPI